MSLGFVEAAEQKLDHQQQAKLLKKVKGGDSISLSDFKTQIAQLSQMGGLSEMMSKLPVPAHMLGGINLASL